MSGSQFLEVMTNTIFDMEDKKNKKGEGEQADATSLWNVVVLYIVVHKHCKTL